MYEHSKRDIQIRRSGDGVDRHDQRPSVVVPINEDEILEGTEFEVSN